MKPSRSGQLVILLASMVLPAFAADVASLSARIGKVQIAGSSASIGTSIEENAIVTTAENSAATLVIASGAVLKLGPETSLTISEFQDKTAVNLSQGSAQIYLAHGDLRPSGKPLVLITPDSTITAKGTIVASQYDPKSKKTLTAALQNNVSITSNSDGIEKTLEQGKSLDSTEADSTLSTALLLAQFSPLDNAARRGMLKIAEDALADKAAAQASSEVQSGDEVPFNSVFARITQEGTPPVSSNTVPGGILITPIPDPLIQQMTTTGLTDSGAIGGGGPTVSSAGFTDLVVRLDSSRNFTFSFRDNGVQDGDLINLHVASTGGKVYLDQTNLPLTTAGQTFKIPVDPGPLTVNVTAVNAGQVPPNTGAFRSISTVIAGKGSQNYSLNQGEAGALRVDARPAGGR